MYDHLLQLVISRGLTQSYTRSCCSILGLPAKQDITIFPIGSLASPDTPRHLTGLDWMTPAPSYPVLPSVHHSRGAHVFTVPPCCACKNPKLNDINNPSKISSTSTIPSPPFLSLSLPSPPSPSHARAAAASRLEVMLSLSLTRLICRSL